MRNYGLIFLMAIIMQSATSTDTTYLTGKVINKNNGKPLTGVLVLAVSTSKIDSAVTNRNGDYRLTLEPGTFELKFQYFYNYDTTFKDVSIKKGNTILNLEILPNILPLARIARSKVAEVRTMPAPDYGSGDLDDPLMPMESSKSERKSAKISDVSSEKAPVAKVVGLSAGVFATEGIEVKESAPAVKSSGGSVPNAQAGTLTSGEVNDFRKWQMWNDIGESDLKTYKDMWKLYLKERYTVQMVTADNKPVVDCPVKLINSNSVEVWAGRTDNTGKAELWANIYDAQPGETSFKVQADYKDMKYEIKSLKKFADGVNILKIDDNCDLPNNVDIVFTVDATGSMGDEINYLKAELKDIISKLKDKHQDKKINLGTVFYRDEDDQYVVKKSDLNSDISVTSSFIAEQQAGGGGDFPEAVDKALMTSINEMNWSPNAVTRIIFLILDAPPHNNPLVIERLQEIIAKAAMNGIRIIPVACSGIDKSTEYFLRSTALATNGTYVFLTDHSGVGDKHLEPTTDKYDVEFMNGLFLRLIDQFTIIPECSNENQFAKTGENYNIFNQDEKHLSESSPDYKNILESLKAYPNPTSGDLTVEIVKDVDEMYITDISGKLISKMDKLTEGKLYIDMNAYPTGIYFIKFRIDSQWGSHKFLLVH